MGVSGYSNIAGSPAQSLCWVQRDPTDAKSSLMPPCILLPKVKALPCKLGLQSFVWLVAAAVFSTSSLFGHSVANICKHYVQLNVLKVLGCAPSEPYPAPA